MNWKVGLGEAGVTPGWTEGNHGQSGFSVLLLRFKPHYLPEQSRKCCHWSPVAHWNVRIRYTACACLSYRVPRARRLSRGVPVDTCFQCDVVVVFGETKETPCTLAVRHCWTCMVQPLSYRHVCVESSNDIGLWLRKETPILVLCRGSTYLRKRREDGHWSGCRTCAI